MGLVLSVISSLFWAAAAKLVPQHVIDAIPPEALLAARLGGTVSISKDKHGNIKYDVGSQGGGADQVPVSGYACNTCHKKGVKLMRCSACQAAWQAPPKQ